MFGRVKINSWHSLGTCQKPIKSWSYMQPFGAAFLALGSRRITSALSEL